MLIIGVLGVVVLAAVIGGAVGGTQKKKGGSKELPESVLGTSTTAPAPAPTAASPTTSSPLRPDQTVIAFTTTLANAQLNNQVLTILTLQSTIDLANTAQPHLFTTSLPIPPQKENEPSGTTVITGTFPTS